MIANTAIVRSRHCLIAGKILVRRVQKQPLQRMSIDIGGMRKPYHNGKDTFDVQDLTSRNPFDQFKTWFDAATKCESIEEANAMCLATATKDGLPSARVVLLKEFGRDSGFVFYTNYESRKACEIAENPNVALMLYWEPLKRAVRIEGVAQKVSEEKSSSYFRSRPFGSQVGAAISNQSQVIGDRATLEHREAELRKMHEDGNSVKPVTKPAHWGGYSVVPRVFEFWQGQSTRIHDRLRFRRPDPDEKIDQALSKGEDGWVIERLQP